MYNSFAKSILVYDKLIFVCVVSPKLFFSNVYITILSRLFLHKIIQLSVCGVQVNIGLCTPTVVHIVI